MRLYSGIIQDQPWPPRDIPADSTAPLPVPYLESTPEVVDVSVGRQLFVDDFLVDTMDLARVWHPAQPHPGNPILVPETEIERHDDCLPIATDSTKAQIRWRGQDSLPLGPFRLRFRLTEGDLYSFWTSNDAAGHSGGYVAAGGPSFTGDHDA